MIGSLLNGIHKSPEILKRCIQLEVMRRSDEQAAIPPNSFQAGYHLLSHILWRTERHSLLEIYRSPETQPVTVIHFNFSGSIAIG